MANKISYHTEDVAYGMKKVVEFAMANDESELKNLTFKQLEDIGHVIAWELAEIKLKEEFQHNEVEQMEEGSENMIHGKKCDVCGEWVKSVYINFETRKEGHKHCV